MMVKAHSGLGSKKGVSGPRVRAFGETDTHENDACFENYPTPRTYCWRVTAATQESEIEHSPWCGVSKGASLKSAVAGRQKLSINCQKAVLVSYRKLSCVLLIVPHFSSSYQLQFLVLIFPQKNASEQNGKTRAWPFENGIYILLL